MLLVRHGQGLVLQLACAGSTTKSNTDTGWEKRLCCSYTNTLSHTHTHSLTHSLMHTHACTHARTHARPNARTHIGARTTTAGSGTRGTAATAAALPPSPSASGPCATGRNGGGRVRHLRRWTTAPEHPTHPPIQPPPSPHTRPRVCREPIDRMLTRMLELTFSLFDQEQHVAKGMKNQAVLIRMS